MSLLETVHLKKYFGDTHAVDDVNLTIEEGEFISLVGPNGAGKTSFCNVVSGASHGRAPPAAIAANALTGHTNVTTPYA